MYRLFHIYCALSLLHQFEGSVYAQGRTSVPVTIILEAPSATKTAQFTLTVTPHTELTVPVPQGAGGRFDVSLSPAPTMTETVNIDLRIVEIPPDGSESDLRLSPEFPLPFTSSYHSETITLIVDLEAKEGDYIIELATNDGGIMDSETFTITVTRGWLLSNVDDPPEAVKLFPGESRTRTSFMIAPYGRDVTFTFSILEAVDEEDLWIHPTELAFPEEDYFIAQPYTINAGSQADPGEYTLVHSFIDIWGTERETARTSIEILEADCTIAFNQDASQSLDFGEWHMSGTESEWSVILNVGQTGSEVISTGVTRTGRQPGAGKLNITAQNCSTQTCSVTSTPDIARLIGNNGGSVDFAMESMGWIGNRIWTPADGPMVYNFDPSLDTDIHFRIGGEVGGTKSETPAGTYEETMTVAVSCLP